MSQSALKRSLRSSPIDVKFVIIRYKFSCKTCWEFCWERDNEITCFGVVRGERSSSYRVLIAVGKVSTRRRYLRTIENRAFNRAEHWWCRSLKSFGSEVSLSQTWFQKKIMGRNAHIRFQPDAAEPHHRGKWNLCRDRMWISLFVQGVPW